jgi:Metallo-beta-lactamase superfamily
MEAARKINEDTYILPSYFPIPGLGLLPVNAFVLKAREPVLVDTGLHMDTDAFTRELEAVIDPTDLKWLYLTHGDQDHVGSLVRLVHAYPNLRVVTTFLGYGVLSLFTDIGPDRIYLLNPGQSLNLGDRRITALRPPSFDNPATTGFVDSKSRTLFSSDCFGALVQEPQDDAGAMPWDALREGQLLWATVDAPWLHQVDRAKFVSDLNLIRQIEPGLLLSSHLPPAQGMTETLLETLASAPDAAPFIGPDQPALEAMLAQMTDARPG